MAKKGGDNKHVCRTPRKVHIPADIRALGNSGNTIANEIAKTIRALNNGEFYRREGITPRVKS